MFSTKEVKPYPTMNPIEPFTSEGRTIMYISDDGLTSLHETQSVMSHLVLFASDADEEIEIYAPISAAN